MLPEDKYFRTLTEDELWQRYCGFLDLSLSEFVDIQQELLLDEVEQVSNSILGKKIMDNQKPQSVEEFRRIVPLTTYEDYEPHLSDQNDDALAIKPLFWCHSAGRGGRFKWIPYNGQALDKFYRLYIANLILAAATRKGEVRIKPGERILLNLAPRPYASGFLFHYLSQVFSMHPIPPQREVENMTFQERIQWGFQIALRTGVDEIFSISSVLVKVGERMAGQAQGMKLSLFMLHPQVFFRLLRAWFRSKLQKRAMLPKDLWDSKAVIAVGTDTAIYKDDIAYYWGRKPWEVYAATEAPGIAVQNWNKKWLTFTPTCAFLEFIPEEESIKSIQDQSYQPSTVLIDEIEEGKLYEVVLTQFYGMPLLRYRIGDVIEVVALSDEETGVTLPQIVFHSRIGETIDLAGLARLTEKIIWQAIVNTGIKYEDWSARKEYERNNTFLRLYIEPKEEIEVAELERLIHEQLKIVDIDYEDIDSHLELQPVKVTSLSKGTFGRYYQEKVKEGADLAWLKPPHMNAPETAIQRLLQLSEQNKG